MPTGAPAIRTSSPVTANAALSKIARTRYGEPAPRDEPGPAIATTAPTATTSAITMAASRLMVPAGCWPGCSPGRPRRRAVGRRLDRAAGTAVCARPAGRRSAPTAACSSAGWSVEAERAEERLRARVVAVGVVVGADLAEVGQRRDDVRRELDEVVELRSASGSSGGSARGTPCARRAPAPGVCCSSEIRSPEPLGLRIRLLSAPIVGIEARVSSSSCVANGASRRDAGFDAADQRVERVERRSQSRERPGRVVQRRRQQRQRLLERRALAGDRARSWRSCWRRAG